MANRSSRLDVIPVEGSPTPNLTDMWSRYSGARFLFVAACAVVVVAGLKMGAPILVPFALALFLAVLTLPIMIGLTRARLPAPLAVLAAVLVDVAVFGLIVLLAVRSLGDVQTRFPVYVARFRGLWLDWIASLEARGVPVGGLASFEFVDARSVADLLGSTLQGVASILSATFVVLLILTFTLSEATVFPEKFRAILGRDDKDSPRLRKVVEEVQEYLGIKTLVSLATGILIGLWAWSLQLDFPVLLGIIGFALNYIPTIGSVLASIPAILLAIVQVSPGYAIVVAAGYLAINLILGNMIEPHLLGRRLGLSTLVVILSLLFWGWVWGPVGMLLAVPLTMVLKIMLENTDDLLWVAVLLDKSAPDVERRTLLAQRHMGRTMWKPASMAAPQSSSSPTPSSAAAAESRGETDAA